MHIMPTELRCPSHHPHPYDDGNRCCASDREAVRPTSKGDPPCDGGRLHYYSRGEAHKKSLCS